MRPPSVISTKDYPDHHDAELAIRCYELRREPSLRAARASMIKDFNPKTEEDVLAVLKGDHPLNTAWRQVSSYWEMVYAMVKHGIVNPDFFLESNGEGLVIFAKVEPFLAALRTQNPRTLLNAEWVASNSTLGRELADRHRKRFAAARGS